MFYEINNELKKIGYQDISPDTLALGYVSAEELMECGKSLGLDEERMISCFIESLLSVNSMVPEKMRNELTGMEESVVRGDAGENLSIELLALKKRILKYCNFYSQMLDVTETLTDNENSILDDSRLIYVSNLTKKVARLNDEMVLLSSMADHIQDAYAALMDQRMNNTMKILTILTTVFFPLTIIVGWYGMNFKYMPELSWRFGYLFVTLLSVVIILVFVIIGRKKKWF